MAERRRWIPLKRKQCLVSRTPRRPSWSLVNLTHLFLILAAIQCYDISRQRTPRSLSVLSSPNTLRQRIHRLRKYFGSYDGQQGLLLCGNSARLYWDKVVFIYYSKAICKMVKRDLSNFPERTMESSRESDRVRERTMESSRCFQCIFSAQQ